MNPTPNRFQLNAFGAISASARILAIWLVLSTSAGAQDIWSYWFNGVSYDTRGDAEEAMRAGHLHGALLEPESTRVIESGSSTFLRTTYYVPFQPPEVLTEPSYTVGGWGPAQGICSASSSDPSRCADEAEMMAGFYRHYEQSQSASCDLSSYYASGSYAIPYHQVTPHIGSPRTAVVRHHFPISEQGRYMKFSSQCDPGGSPSHHEHWMSKSAIASCPEGMVARSGFAPPYANGEDEVSLDQMCRSTLAKPYIDSKVLQVACEPGNCNPVYPGTGDKARFETDFIFAGREFGRSYHSLLMEDPTRTIDRPGTTDPMRTLAPGWQHSYSDKLYAERNPKTLFTDRGYYDFFKSLGSGVFRSETNPDRILRDIGSGHRLIEPDGSTKEFDDDGNLVRVYHPNDPANALTGLLPVSWTPS